MTFRKGALSSRKNKQSPYHRRRKAKASAKATEQSQAEGWRGFDVSPLQEGLSVLSLFDGISTALVALDKLRLHVTKYYSSEIDSNALKVQRHQFGDRITRVGCVEGLRGERLEALGRISLLIGGSPCSDLTLLNPRRRGLHEPSSTGALFFEYVRIRNFLAEKSEREGLKFYWLFENTSHMETHTREDMTRALGMQPVVRDAKHFLPVHRKRLFWGNLEGMSTAPRPHTPLTLADILPPTRGNVVDTIPTLTTTYHSQKSGRKKSLPIVEDGKESGLFITEVECLFGFPAHFTDGPNLSVTDRRKLLGKAFCVPVVQDLLSPLTDHFWTREYQPSFT